MTRKKIRICKICGTDYSYCPHCGDDENKPKWMFLCDTEECFDVFQALSDYSFGHKDVVEIYERIKNADTTKMIDSVAEQVKEIIEKYNELNSKEENINKEETTAENTEEKSIEETTVKEVVNKKKYYNNKK